MSKKSTHYRRCHMCGTISESDETICNCHHCGKKMARFYYFDDNKVKALADDRMRPVVAKGHYQPIYGLTVTW